MTSLHTPAATALPARLRLARHRSVLPLGAGARVVGLDPDTAFVVDGLPPPLAALLDRLDRPARTAELVARPPRRAACRPPSPGSCSPSWSSAGALVDAAPAERAARARAGGVISVRGRGPLAVGLVTGLLHSGIGTVHTDTGGAVRGADLGTGYADADRGGERLAATQAAVRRLLPCGRARGPRRCGRARISSSSPTRRPSPALVDELRARGLAHLAVRLRDGVGVVGPLVYPGRTACLGCLDLHPRRPRPPLARRRRPAGRARGRGRSGRRHRHGRARRGPGPSRPSTAGTPPRSAPRSSSTSTRAGSAAAPGARIPECPCGAAAPSIALLSEKETQS